MKFPAYLALQALNAMRRGVDVDLNQNEQYQMQMAGICTAAIGYWKENDEVHSDYDTPALRDVARLYAKYAAYATEIEQLKAERDALKADAERYRWLKRMWTTSLLDGSILFANAHGVRCKSVSEIDAALDAARK